MQEIKISGREAGQRLDKFLGKYLREAGSGFLHKMLRKKNITLNGKKADGSERLSEGDCLRLFLAEETIRKFQGENSVRRTKTELDFVYEDAQVLFVNKPAGMLSQKAAPEDISLCEHLISYLLQSGQITEEELTRFRPGVCNRLDRNTSGLVAAGKTLTGLQALSELFRSRRLEKYYLALVQGTGTVSYTHLDVYKRQVQYIRERGQIDPCISRGSKKAMISPMFGRGNDAESKRNAKGVLREIENPPRSI